ncbi:hypothetical protein RJ639_000493 [Escallonia herrerae]|uniref:Integrase catalytic domain-containing protein n=1 Tax=Escallonia herrerae TaxID=1293975 RepID=A0AA88XCD7_9ASTE|nr:hypothetical protein RJ639_000493 [Escallonia herrerae]
MKFPTKHGIGEVKGDQTVARQCYVTSCRSKNKEALIIEDLWEDMKMQRREPVEDLKNYEARDERMAQYLQLVKTLASKFKNFTIHQIPWDLNTQADTLSRLASVEVTERMDLLGPLPLASGQQRFVTVAIDYFKKWTETEALATITLAKSEDFFWKNIVYCFGVPKALVVDNGNQFDNSNFQTFCTNLSIDLRFTYVAHP